MAETFQNVVNLKRWSCGIDFPEFCDNFALGGKLWICWKEGVDVEIIDVNKQCITILYSDTHGARIVTFVYAKCD